MRLIDQLNEQLTFVSTLFEIANFKAKTFEKILIATLLKVIDNINL